jgi:hypothetical protein
MEAGKTAKEANSPSSRVVTEQESSRNKPTARTRQHSEQENAKAAAA